MKNHLALPNPQKGWLPLIIISFLTVAIFIVSVISLLSGWQTIFQNLFYFPIILACVFYVKRGFIFSVLLACCYFVLMAIFSNDPVVLQGAVIRVMIFILVAFVITYLSMIRIRAEDELKESREFLNKIINSISDPIHVKDRQHRVILINDAAGRLFNLPREEIIGKTAYDLFPGKEVADNSWLKDEEVFRTGVESINEETNTYAHGKTLSVLVKKTLYTDSAGNQFLVGTTTDITERKQAMTDLLSARDSLKEAHRLAHIGTWTRVTETDTVTWSEELCNIAGRDRSLPAPAYSELPRIYTPASWDLLNDAVTRALITGEPYNLELELVHPDGSIRWTNEFGGVKRDGDGKVIGLHGTVQDITVQKREEEALQRLTEFQESVITNARVWLSVLDLKGTILLWNTAAEEISGYRSEEVIGEKDIWRKIYPDNEYRKQVTDTISRIIRDKNYLENFETTILSKQGEHKVISWNTRGIPDSRGNVSDYIAIGVDVTDRIRAEEELRETERRLGDIINFLPDATFAIDREGRVIAWNRAIEEMTGVRAENMLGKGDYEYALPICGERRPILIDLVTMQDPGVLENYTSVRRDGDALTAETTRTQVDGKNFSIWGKSILFKNNKGNVVGAIESIRDITERKQVEEALKASQIQLADAMDLAHMVDWEFDVATGIFTFNDRFYALYGTTAELEGGNQMPADVYAKKFVHPDDLLVVSDEVNKAIMATDPGYVSQAEHRIIRRDGEIRYIIVRFGITKDEHGRTIKTHGANQDITDRKRAEDALNQANKKLNLLSSITRHDITNQLMVLMGYLGILKKKQPDSALEGYFQKIGSAAERISSMIRFTKEYEAIGVLAPAWQDCHALVETAAKEATLGQVTIKNDLPAGSEVFADPLIVKVFYNLMDNAVRYGGKITMIRFSDQESGNVHIVVCEDDGVGVPLDEKEKIFDRGFGKNTGLGLFLSREILAITGITINETGEPGNGARFEMTVPKGMFR